MDAARVHTSEGDPLPLPENRVAQVLLDNPRLTNREIRKALGFSNPDHDRNVLRAVNALRARGLVERTGFTYTLTAVGERRVTLARVRVTSRVQQDMPTWAQTVQRLLG
jgi:DNA-binding Lrp family transcriptional regulator